MQLQVERWQHTGRGYRSLQSALERCLLPHIETLQQTNVEINIY